VPHYVDLSNGSNRSDRRRNAVDFDLSVDFTIGVLLRAVARDVAGLTALIARLAGRVERTAVGSSAVAGDVAKLAASIALHGLSLAVAGKVVGTTALVARGRAGAAGETTTATETAAVTATRNGATATHSTGADGVGARTSQVAGLATVVASTAGASAAQA
jgi:hypothetical protein